MNASERQDDERPTLTAVSRATRERASAWPGPFVRGEVISGAYRIDGVLGQGGMGVVYLAHDMHLSRNVALKVSSAPHYTDMLHREAQALAAVRHPGVVAVHAMGAHRQHPYLVLERLLGSTLQQRIDSARAPFSIDETLDLAIGICDALSAAHRAGLAHRDLKPGNVFVCGARIVLLDFGLFVPEYSVGAENEVAGSVEYMAPEVISSSVAPGSGPLIDLYALGIIIFELLVGRTPFVADRHSSILSRHLSEPIPDLADLRPETPRALIEVVEGLLEKSPVDRLGSAESVLWQLCAIRGDGARTGLQAFRVLVIDDDPSIASILRRSLKQAMPQLVVEAEHDPALALAEIERDCPDLVLMDLNMPVVNGVELMMQLRALPSARRPRVVAMSAEATDRDIALLRALGVVDFAAKDASFVNRISSIVGELRHR